MGSIPHDLWVSALPRLLAASYGLAMAAALIIRLLWRRRRSPLSYRPGRRARHGRPPLKSGTGRGAP
jgi:hypothetical protein